MRTRRNRHDVTVREEVHYAEYAKMWIWSVGAGPITVWKCGFEKTKYDAMAKARAVGDRVSESNPVVEHSVDGFPVATKPDRSKEPPGSDISGPLSDGKWFWDLLPKRSGFGNSGYADTREKALADAWDEWDRQHPF